MKLLLDTHVFLWFLAGDPRLRASARRRIESVRDEKWLSIASVWEIAIKLSLGKLDLRDPLAQVVERGTRESGILLLSVTKADAIRVASLPWHHRDPFDRMLAAQAIEHDLTLLTGDVRFDAYELRRSW